jgi:predicted AlkP superfamily pyrophosphatase or phosphodiesterase
MLTALLALGALGFQAPSAGPHSRRPPRQPHPEPALVVLIAVDQLRADYLERFGAQLTGGLARVRAQAAYFVHGLQDHAITETAPGHSTMLSGRDPAHTGIVSNGRGVPDPLAPLLGVAGGGAGASPRRFVGTTLYDWMLAADSGTRVLSVSRKDRGAILPVGRAKGDVYWYADGLFTTSRYYADSLPGWVRDYNVRQGPQRLAGAKWELLLPASEYAEPDSRWFENGGSDIAFPHVLPTLADSALQRLVAFPWMDSLTLDFALTGVRRLGLGTRARPDLLVVSLSTTDAIGHAFGPDSREIHDQILRLDRWLGAFLDSLGTSVPPDRTVMVLTSDHGVRPLPEYLTAVGHVRGGRVWLSDVARAAARALGSRFHADFDIDFDTGLLSADVPALRARGIDVDSLADALAADARGHLGVAHVYTPRSLARAPRADVAAQRWKRQLPAEYGWLLCATLADGWVWSPGKVVAEHGSTGDEDITVPIAFMGPGIRAARLTTAARTVDIGPTLAAYLGLRPTEPVDGRVLREVIATPETRHVAVSHSR